jgi:hypothetical protein
MTGAGEPVALPQEPRLLELGVGVWKIVQVEVGDVLSEPRIQRPATLVARAVEGRLAARDELPHGVVKRCGAVHRSTLDHRLVVIAWR